MTAAPSSERLALESLVARVADEFVERQKRGENPDAEEYAARYPEYATVLREVLAALQLVRLSGGAGPAGPPADDLLVGTLGDFCLVREVGRGGMGVVYEAEQVSLGRRVALKVLPMAATLDPRQLQRFHNEARAAAGLHHTNIVPVYGVGCERGVHYYAMQFIDGRTLADLIAEHRVGPPSQVPTMAEAPAAASASTVAPAAQATSAAPRDSTYFRRAAEWGIQAAEALDYAHALGVVHRDIKPANLLVDGAGRLWVTDFGLAHMPSDARLTLTGDLVGTLRYMSPEQALAKRVVIDHRTDVYSLGATLYELLTLQPAFAGGDRQELLRQIAFEEPRPPRRLDRAVPADLDTIVLKALEKNPHERYATAQELADDLQRYLRDDPVRARRPSLARRARKWARRHRAAVTAAAVCLLVTLAAVVGSIGWVLGDRAARQDKVREALDAAGPALREGNPWDHTLMAVAERAQAQLDGGPVSQDLRRRVEQLQKDIRMLAELEQIRLDRAGGPDLQFEGLSTAPQYARAFRDYGIDLEALGPAGAAVLVQESAIREYLVAGLGLWAADVARRGGADLGQAQQMLAVVRAVDTDPWRNRLRDPLLSRNPEDLDRLARSAPVEELPPATLALLGQQLALAAKRARPSGPTLEILRRAQRRFPADFWTNYYLGATLRRAQPLRLEEAIGFVRVAVALRPLSPGAHNELGAALANQGRLEEAIAEHREALRLMQGYAEAHNGLGYVLLHQGRLNEAAAEFREAVRLKPEYAEAHNNLAVALGDEGRLDDSVKELREAIRLERDDAGAHTNLGLVLADQGRLEEAVAEHREAIRLKPDSAEAHTNLGIALNLQGRPAEAIAEYREAVRVNKEFARAHNNLAVALGDEGRLDDSVKELREAIRLEKDYADAHCNLGLALWKQGRLDEAIVECREAIRLEKDHAGAHVNLGLALRGKGQLDEAIAEYREAIRLKCDLPDAHNNLGNALHWKGRLDEAVAEFREALRLRKDDFMAHYNLGNVIADQGRLDEAVAEYREALRLRNDYAEAHCNLGLVLQAQHHFADALAELKRGHELGSRRPGWPYPSAEWVRSAKRLVAVDARLPQLLARESQPEDAEECLVLAHFCREHRKRFLAAARWYAEAFAAQPTLANDPSTGNRYNAACAAAMAGVGQGVDADKLDASERARLRQQAADWLRADLAVWRKALEKDPSRAAAVVRAQLQHWLEDPDFAGVRGPKALAGLPEAERAVWRQLWTEVEQLLPRAGGKGPGPAACRVHPVLNDGGR